MAFTPLTALLATMRQLPELPALREIVAGGEAMVLTHKVRDFLAAHPECRCSTSTGRPRRRWSPRSTRSTRRRTGRRSGVRSTASSYGCSTRRCGRCRSGRSARSTWVVRPLLRATSAGRRRPSAAFVPDPGHPGGRLYRSRDLGRWRADGHAGVPRPRGRPGEDPRSPGRAGRDRARAGRSSPVWSTRWWSRAPTRPGTPA